MEACSAQVDLQRKHTKGFSYYISQSYMFPVGWSSISHKAYFLLFSCYVIQANLELSR